MKYRSQSGHLFPLLLLVLMMSWNYSWAKPPGFVRLVWSVHAPGDLPVEAKSSRADSLKSRTDSLVKFIDRIKATLIDRIQKDKPYKPFLTEEGAARELKARLNTHKEYVMKEFKDLRPEGLLDQIDLDDRREEDKVITWEHYYLEDVPLSAIIANLTKLKNSLREIESSIKTRLH
jgi:hypothetical protein